MFTGDTGDDNSMLARETDELVEWRGRRTQTFVAVTQFREITCEQNEIWACARVNDVLTETVEDRGLDAYVTRTDARAALASPPTRHEMEVGEMQEANGPSKRGHGSPKLVHLEGTLERVDPWSWSMQAVFQV